MEKLRPNVERSPKYFIRAVCFECNWTSQLPSSLLRLPDDMELVRDMAQAHEERFDHSVRIFATKAVGVAEKEIRLK